MAKLSTKYKTTGPARPAPAESARVVGDVTAQYERNARKPPKEPFYVLRLYVTGTSPRSMTAIANIRRVCDDYLKGRVDLEVIDIYQQPRLAEGEQIIAAPTLVKELPYPLRKVVGDLSNESNVLIGLDLKPRPS